MLCKDVQVRAIRPMLLWSYLLNSKQFEFMRHLKTLVYSHYILL